ncbi:hypothetical protein IscW_ISCW019320 [Ixodes scapularis]|uniref:Uncharacterized protein n=1 Tax=Ixodes scapularis TaxID=6945 RepID=B7PTA9_IXOSC|nr:hypothetical protein IscW_ISCW019320 [Ixodes scapularis]|eukprot:XP_002404098.1 hypothetical protein IscW_ISCW019320 [Ixodes scapularis]
MHSYVPSIEGDNRCRRAVRLPVFVCTLSTRSSGNGRCFCRTKPSRWSVGMLPSLPLGAGPVAVCRGVVGGRCHGHPEPPWAVHPRLCFVGRGLCPLTALGFCRRALLASEKPYFSVVRVC